MLIRTGNHDITLDSEFYNEHGLYFHNQYPQDAAACRRLLADFTITFLNHESAEITLKRESGPRTTFKIFGSPYSPAGGLWAFGYQPSDASTLWDQIPLDVDIVLTHTPPKYHCDESGEHRAAGCEILRQSLWRIRPQLAICGHVHEGRGAERILWDLHSPNVKYKEDITGYWTDPDPGGKKQCLLDLTARGPAPLRNQKAQDPSDLANTDGLTSGTLNGRRLNPWKQNHHLMSSPQLDNHEMINTPTNALLRGTAGDVISSEAKELIPATRGQGGMPPSGRCDMEALLGRLGRRETCVINAAVMASSWPYKVSNGQKYNKPFVVDIDLPSWESTTINEGRVGSRG